MKPTSICLLIPVSMMAKSQVNKVVFVCERGAAKSVIAADYFNIENVDSDYSHRRDAIVKQVNMLIASLKKQ